MRFNRGAKQLQKINQLKKHFESIKAETDEELANYAELLQETLTEIETVKMQIADLTLVMSE